MSEGFDADPESIDGSANLLLEIAGLLREGRLDKDAGTLARSPHAHPDVSVAVDRFARYADDQYQDLALLLTALSTALKTTGNNYVKVDAELNSTFRDVLDTSRYVAPRRATA